MSNDNVVTERLTLRRFREDDFNDLCDLVRDKMASEYTPYDTQWPTDDDNLHGVLGYFMSDDAWYAVELNAENRVIGFVVMSRTDDEDCRSLGYTIRRDYQRRGYAFEAASALMKHYTENGIRRFSSGTAFCNEPSVGLLTKLGFVVASVFDDATFANDENGRPILFRGAHFTYSGND